MQPTNEEVREFLAELQASNELATLEEAIGWIVV